MCRQVHLRKSLSICELNKLVISQFHLKMHKLVKQEKELVAKLGESEAGRMRTNLIAGVVPILAQDRVGDSR